MIVDLNVLKSRFSQGDKPSAGDYEDLIDTLVNIAANSVGTASIAPGSVTPGKIAVYTSGSGTQTLQCNGTSVFWA